MVGVVQTYMLHVEGAELFTVVLLPEAEGKFPVVLIRNPYVDEWQEKSVEELKENYLSAEQRWLEKGYAVIKQHCRGRGHSTGDCIPYINEREDGLALQAWVREQSFYNGEIYLCGGSYLASVHYVTAPFAEDIKGAVLNVQDSERYNVLYRNGFYKSGLDGSWYVGMYKKKSMPVKNFTPESFHILPLSAFSRTVFGEEAEVFNEQIRHPNPNDPFWKTHWGGGEASGAVKNTKIPVLLATGFYDIYTGGVFDMWFAMDEETRARCALAVHPFAHGGVPEGQPYAFENGKLNDYAANFAVTWIESIRGKCEPPFEPGKITYYRLFENKWHTDAFAADNDTMQIPLGTGEITYTYNPYDPASFKGGLSANFGGSAFQDPPNQRYDIKTFYSEEFAEDRVVHGKIRAKLCVKSDCEDTCFYMRLSLVKPEGDFGLRDDITQLSNYTDSYVPGEEIEIDFTFDEHSFLVHKGEKIRIDVSSSADPHYVRHTNQKGLFSEQTTAKIAHNTIVCDKSYVTLPIE